MKSQDEYYYVVEDDFIAHFKNGLLHREAGPAVYHIKLKDKYSNLEDKDLYSLKVLKVSPGNIIIFYTLTKYYEDPDQVTTFYLEDKELTAKEFYSIKDQKELEQELGINKSTTKKIKL